MRKKENKEIVRYSPEVNFGLTTSEVDARKKDKLTNITKIAVGKSYGEIIATNLFSFFNVLLYVIAGFMIYAGHYSGLFFLFVLIPNIIIGLYEDIKSKILLSKLRVMTQPTVTAIRDGKSVQIESKDIVLDDIVELSQGYQICSDGVVKEGFVSVNESLLTGESQSISKQIGDKVYAGSFVVSGKAKVQCTSVGKDNYVQSIQDAANKFRRSPSEILKSLKRMFLIIGIIVVAIGVATFITYQVQGSFSNEQMIKDSIANIAGSMVSMIPSGLYLLTSMALAAAVVSLARRKAQIQDFYSVEMLARVDCLCVDKTGTITDGSMEFKRMLLLGNEDEVAVKQIMSNLLIATGDNNFTAHALRQEFNYNLTAGIAKAMPFDSEHKCSGASFKGGKTYVLGAPEFLNLKNKVSVLSKAEEYTHQGYRVLVLAQTRSLIGEHFKDTLEPVAIIVLQDHVKNDAKKTFTWFSENGVNIKVISGDNAITVSEVAKQAGIPDADNYISLEGMTLEEVREIATRYTVFGRVTPEQKEVIVLALKEAGKTVAMTGDGVNDILALKRADCSIAMASGADAARNVSHIVLLDSKFSRLPDVVAEGRRVINNLQRTCSVFLVKTIFAVTLSIAFLLASIILRQPSIKYEFLTNTMYIWEIVGIGLPAFFLALQRNNEQIKGSFIKNIFSKAIPAGIFVILGVASVYVLFILHKNGIALTGVLPNDGDPFRSDIARSMCVIIYSLFSLVVLFNVCKPFDRYRKLIFAAFATLGAGAVIVAAIFSLVTGHQNIFLIRFDLLGAINYLEIAIILVVISTLFITTTYIMEVMKGEHLEDEN